jgi:cytochrome c oxidase assembly protein subunit 15
VRGRTRALAWGFGALTAVVYALLVVGALVRAHGAGLACPDWPLCFGRLVPAFDLKVAFEYGHRALAGTVSVLFAGLSLAVLRSADLRPRLRRLLGFAALLLGVQVVFGGLTVLLKLAPWTVTAHLLLGTGFCATLLWIARDLFELGAPPSRAPLPRGVQVAVLATAGALVAQLVLGGLVSSQGAGLACWTFPRCDGASFVPTLGGLTGLHVIHRLNALVLLAAFGSVAWLARDRARPASLAWIGLRLAVLQIAVGALNVLAQLPRPVTAVHSGLAAAIALTVLLLVRELRLSGVASTAPSAAPALR